MQIERLTGKNGTYLNLYPKGEYDPTEYERPTVTVDTCICTVMNSQLKVLLIKRNNAPFKGKWAIPGGFVNIKDMEDIDDASTRELKEETGVTGITVRQLHTYGKAKRDPRWRTVDIAYYALVPINIIQSQKIKADDDASDYQWFSLSDLPKLGFDHVTILTDLRNRLIDQINYSPIGFELVGKRFTWNELQNAYESVLGRNLIASNFRRVIKRMYIIEECSEMVKNNAGRPAMLLKFSGAKSNF